MNIKDLLIIEKSTSELNIQNSEDGSYVLEGVFGELDKKNRNNRIYTADEYLPQIESLQAKIAATKLLGELDHPQNFDISLKNVSHIIEEISYNESQKQIRGRIRLLNTDAGRQAKALVDAGVPLQISSRAAGTVESNGKVKVKQLFTYDLVADPGFENAELKRVNESYGLAEDDAIQIFEINNTEQKQPIQKNKIENKPTEKMAESKFITQDDFNSYSKYLAEEIKSIKEQLNKNNNIATDTSNENLKEYVNYLGQKLDENIEKTDNVVKYTQHVAEKTDQGIQYTESLAKTVDQGIQYSEHVAEGVQKIKEYANYLAESYNEGVTDHQNLLEYIDYLKGNLENVTEYAEYMAKTVNENLLTEGQKMSEKDVIDAFKNEILHDIKKQEDNGPDVPMRREEFNNFVDALNKDGQISDELADSIALPDNLEESNHATGKEGDQINSDAKDTTKSTKDSEGKEYKHGEINKDMSTEVQNDLKGKGDAQGKVIGENADTLDEYKNSITEKLQNLISKAEEKKTADPHFFRFVSESTRDKYKALENKDKSKVLNAVEGKGFLTEGQILNLWDKALVNNNENTNEANVISMMPKEYKETWDALSESKKNQILAQSKYHVLQTEYQVSNFWQTRDLRENVNAKGLEKVSMVKESNEEDKKLPYDLTDLQESLKKRFKK